MQFGEEAWRLHTMEVRCPLAEVLLLLAVVSCRFQIIRSFLTLKGTAPVATYGPLQRAYLTAQEGMLTEANAKSIGMKSLPAKKPSPNSKTGFRRVPWTPRAISMSPSKGRSPRP